MKKKIFFPSVLLLLFFASKAQPFAADIAAFKKQDSMAFPAANQILFVGSSSFTKWTDVQDYFPNKVILNRGFGGSTLADLIRYEREIILPYHAKQIVIYCGENDIASSDTVSPTMVLKRFKVLYKDIRQQYPSTPIIYISLKPSILRWQLRDRMKKANSLIQQYLSKKKRKARFLNVWDAMLGPDGNPMPDIFIGDRLHMNANGYAIWEKLLAPYLIN